MKPNFINSNQVFIFKYLINLNWDQISEWRICPIRNDSRFGPLCVSKFSLIKDYIIAIGAEHSVNFIYRNPSSFEDFSMKKFWE